MLDTADPGEPNGRVNPAAIASAARAFVDAIDLEQTGVGLIGFDRQALRVVSGRDRASLVAGLAYLAAPTRPGRRIDVALAAAALDVGRAVGAAGRGEVIVVSSGPRIPARRSRRARRPGRCATRAGSSGASLTGRTPMPG